jgi:hypothetical protein
MPASCARRQQINRPDGVTSMMPEQGQSRHARSPYLPVLKACDLHRGLDRGGVVCLAIAVIEKGHPARSEAALVRAASHTGRPNGSAARTVITSAARGAAGSIEPKRRWWFVENSGMVSRRLEASRLDSGRSK